MMNDLIVTLDRFINLLGWVIVIRALLSWVIKDPRHPVAAVIGLITEPILSPIRKLLKVLNIGGNTIDFSPLIAVLILQIASNVIRAVF